MQVSNIKLFESKQIRTVWNEADEKWYFVVEDVIWVLTDSKDPKQYIKRMRQAKFSFKLFVDFQLFFLTAQELLRLALYEHFQNLQETLQLIHLFPNSQKGFL